MKNKSRALIAIVLSLAFLFTFLPASVNAAKSVVDRDDGIWLFPLPKAKYSTISDWAGCSNNYNGNCMFCGQKHKCLAPSHSTKYGHQGIDITAAKGTDVYASADGIVYWKNKTHGARGYMVVMEHKRTDGKSYYTIYQHLSEVKVVTNGTTVKAGTVIAKTGDSGSPDSYHLHFAMLLAASGKGAALSDNSGLSTLEGKGWLRSSTNSDGAIVTNPAIKSPAGLPTKASSGSLTNLLNHSGSVRYTLDKNEVSYSGQQDEPIPSIIPTDIDNGEYTFRNGGGFYLDAESDKDGGNVNVAAAKDSLAQQWSVTKSGDVYRVSSKNSSSKRVLNVYTSGASATGNNVTLWQVTGHATQLWRFEEAGGGYRIHPSDNLNIALAVVGGNDVKLAANSESSAQIWYLESQTATPTPTPPAIQTPTPEPNATPTPEPPETSTPEPPVPPKPPEPIEPPETPPPLLGPTTRPTPGAEDDYRVAIPGESNGYLYALVTEVGIKFDWTPNSSNFGYRIYRAESPGDEGISISDFPLKEGQFVDVSIMPNTDYYYTICRVDAEAGFDRATMTIIPESLGERSSEIVLNSEDMIIMPIPTEDTVKNFIMMKIGEPTMLFNEVKVEIDPGRGTAPLIDTGRTLVPIRAIIEAMGGIVLWEDSTQSITLISGDTAVLDFSVEMAIDSHSLIANGVNKTMDTAPKTINERTMLPLRFVSENVGSEIAWIGSTQEIIIVFYTLT